MEARKEGTTRATGKKIPAEREKETSRGCSPLREREKLEGIRLVERERGTRGDGARRERRKECGYADSARFHGVTHGDALRPRDCIARLLVKLVRSIGFTTAPLQGTEHASNFQSIERFCPFPSSSCSRSFFIGLSSSKGRRETARLLLLALLLMFPPLLPPPWRRSTHSYCGEVHHANSFDRRAKVMKHIIGRPRSWSLSHQPHPGWRHLHRYLPRRRGRMKQFFARLRLSARLLVSLPRSLTDACRAAAAAKQRSGNTEQGVTSASDGSAEESEARASEQAMCAGSARRRLHCPRSLPTHTEMRIRYAISMSKRRSKLIGRSAPGTCEGFSFPRRFFSAAVEGAVAGAEQRL